MPIFKAVDRPGKNIKTVIYYAAKDTKKEKDNTLFFGVNCADNPAIAAYQMAKNFIIKLTAGNISIMSYLLQTTK